MLNREQKTTPNMSYEIFKINIVSRKLSKIYALLNTQFKYILI